MNLAKVQENLNLIGVFLEKLEKVARIPKKAFLADERNPAASESFLRRCIEAIIDIGRHILSKSFSSKSLEYQEVALELGDKGVISKNYAGTLVKTAGYRNRLVHHRLMSSSRLPHWRSRRAGNIVEVFAIIDYAARPEI